MHIVVSQLLHNTLYGSFVLLPLLVIKAVMMKFGASKNYFLMWMIPVFCYLNPISFIWGVNLRLGFADEIIRRGFANAVTYSFFTVWIIGAIISFLFYESKKRKLLRPILNSLNPASKRDESALYKMREALKIKRRIAINSLDVFKSPVIIGILQPRIILPRNHNLTDTELKIALIHELNHVKHGDLLFKYLATITTII